MQSKKVCLINPRLEGPYPPLGLAYLSAYLKKYGDNNYDIKIIDGNCTGNILSAIRKANPSIIGFTALSPQIRDAVNLSKIIRHKHPGIFQVIGGLHVSAEPEQTLRKGSFDLAIIGEGELTFKEVTDIFFKSGKDKKLYSGINGIAYVDNEKFIMTPKREEINDLDSIPFPDRSLLDMRHYLSHYLIIRGLTGNKITTIHTSRGCPYNCIFCSCGIVFRKVRYFSIDYVFLEIKELVNKYKVKSLFFTDDTFVLNKGRVRDLSLKLINEGISQRLKWEIQARANLIDWPDLSLLKLMKQAGCVQIDYGFESGSDKILKFLKQGDTSIEYNKRAIQVTKEAGLNVMGTFMVGVPGETENDLELTRKFVLENQNKIDNFQIFIATPYPGAKLYEICRENRTVKEDYFDQLKDEEKIDFRPCYTDSIPCEKVTQTQRLLNRLAARRIKLSNRILWFLFNFMQSPLKTIKRAYFSLSS